MNTILNLSLTQFWTTPEVGCKANAKIREHYTRPVDVDNPRVSTWFGMTDRERADLPCRGWPEGVQKAQALLQDTGIAPGAASLARRWNWEDGETLDYGRLLDDLAPWQEFKRTAGCCGGRILTLAIMCGDNAGCPASEMAWRAYATVRAVDDLENAGYRVELLAIFQTMQCTPNRRDNLEHRVLVKAAEEPLDLSQIAAIISPAATRDYWFRQIEAYPKPIRDGYGTGPKGAEPLEPIQDAIMVDRNVKDETSANAFLATIDEKAEAA